MVRKLIVPCVVALSLIAGCHAGGRIGPVHGGGGVDHVQQSQQK